MFFDWFSPWVEIMRLVYLQIHVNIPISVENFDFLHFFLNAILLNAGVECYDSFRNIPGYCCGLLNSYYKG